MTTAPDMPAASAASLRQLRQPRPQLPPLHLLRPARHSRCTAAWLVTGGAQGLGEAIAAGLAAAGAHVLVVARSAPRVAAAVDRLRALGGSAEGLPLDITDDAAVEAAFAHIDAAHGRLDILVNNAGAPAQYHGRARRGRAAQHAGDQPVAPYALCRHAAQRMRAGATGASSSQSARLPAR